MRLVTNPSSPKKLVSRNKQPERPKAVLHEPSPSVCGARATTWEQHLSSPNTHIAPLEAVLFPATLSLVLIAPTFPSRVASWPAKEETAEPLEKRCLRRSISSSSSYNNVLRCASGCMSNWRSGSRERSGYVLQRALLRSPH